MGKHVAIYLRVSDDRQDTANQRLALEKWVAVYASDATIKWYEDEGETGRNMNRSAWIDLEHALYNNQVEKIVVQALDRLGRACAALSKLFNDLIALKVPLISLRESLDLFSPAGLLVANVLAAVAQFESDIISERTKAGMQRAKAQGKRIGGGKAGRRTTPPDKVDAILQVLDAQYKAKKRFNKRACARICGVHITVVYSIMNREGVLRGYKWPLRYQNHHDPYYELNELDYYRHGRRNSKSRQKPSKALLQDGTTAGEKNGKHMGNGRA